MPTEFDLIATYFAPLGSAIGDDCALLDLPLGHQLVVSTDTQVEGVHFPKHAPSHKLAWRALGAALSDLAAAGATPLGVTLALTLPAATDPWLAPFSRGLDAALRHFNVALLGGDTTKGPLNINFTVMGSVPTGQHLLRSGAQVGDLIYVTATLGDARAALDELHNENSRFAQAYWQPAPPLLFAQSLRRVASAAIDISDGLLADLGHICAASGVAARIDQRAVPVSKALADAGLVEYALTGGDDYQLCFTVGRDQVATVSALAQAAQVQISPVGEIIEGQGVIDSDGNRFSKTAGYNHFAVIGDS